MNAIPQPTPDASPDPVIDEATGDGSPVVEEDPAPATPVPLPILDFDTTHLPSRVAKHVIDLVKSVPKAWPQMTHAEQNALIGQAVTFGRDLVDELDRTIAGMDRVVIEGTLVDYKHGDKKFEAKLDLEMSKGMAGDLYEARGREVLVVVAGAGRFKGDADDIQPDAPKDNQPELPFDGDGEDEGDEDADEDPPAPFSFLESNFGAQAFHGLIPICAPCADRALVKMIVASLNDEAAEAGTDFTPRHVANVLSEIADDNGVVLLPPYGGSGVDLVPPEIKGGIGRPSKEDIAAAEAFGAASFRAGRTFSASPADWSPSVVAAFQRGWSTEQGKVSRAAEKPVFDASHANGQDVRADRKG